MAFGDKPLVEKRTLYDGDPILTDSGGLILDHHWLRHDAFVDVAVRITLPDGKVVTRRARRVRVTYEHESMLGFETPGTGAEANVLPDGDDYGLVDIGPVTEDEYLEPRSPYGGDRDD